MDLNELKEILRLLGETDVAEFELEKEGTRLRIRKAGPPSAAAPPVLVAPVGTPVTAAAPPPVAAAGADSPPASAPGPSPRDAEDDGLTVIKSPIVGTFYRSSDPNAPPFVSIGDHVKPGQVLCIIEAMKLMNEIEAEVAGEIVKVHPGNGQPVQYGEQLFSIRLAS